MASLSDSLDLPKAFGPYTLLRRLAVGGMAEVYVAKTKGIGGFEKLVAIKVIHPRFSEDAHFVQMLVEEAKISVQLTHVNIAQTFDLGCIDDTYYIAMELIEGADTYRVQRRLEDRKIPMPLDIAAFIGAEVCNGLAYAHRKRDHEGRPLGIVHRDISPQNVLVSYSGEVKLVDFGIAKAALRGGQTEVGVIKGKYYYMSPEQAWGDPVDGRTDIFATGILLHELLTGVMVYQEENVPALLDRVRKADVPSPRKRRPDVPPELEAIVMKAVAREPADRYPSAQAMAQDLMRFLYAANPTFTSSRLGQLMATLFPDEVRRHSQILKLPEVPDSEEVRLDPLKSEELAPIVKESSVIFNVADVAAAMTRNDLVPGKRATGPKPQPKPQPERSTAPLSSPVRREETTTAKVQPRRSDDWEDETLLKESGGWDESTLVDEGGQMAAQVDRLLGAKRRVEEVSELADLPADKTVAMAEAPPMPAPKAPLPPPSPRAGPGPRPPPPPARAAEPAPELAPERTVALAGELPAEKTVAFSEAAIAQSAQSGTRKRPLAGPSSAGVRLSAEAERFFSQTTGVATPAAGPFDPLPTAPLPPKPVLVDPFAPVSTVTSPPDGGDPFAFRPATMTGPHEPLGKPQPARWILPVLLGGLVVALLVGGGIYLLSGGSEPLALEVISVPEGASVTLDGRPVPGTTPLTVTDGLIAGRSHVVQVTKSGYEPYSATVTIQEGMRRQIFVLNQIRATLRVETDPPGAEIWVDGVLRGPAPLDVVGLVAGQTVEVRAAAPGRRTVAQQVTIGADDRTARVQLVLPL